MARQQNGNGENPMDKILCLEAQELRQRLMNRRSLDDRYGPTGAIAYQQALKFDRLVERYSDRDKPVSAEEMEADAAAWIAGAVEEDPEVFDAQLSGEAFEAIPETDRKNRRFMEALTSHFNGEKNVPASVITDELLEELRREADPRYDVETDGEPVVCAVSGKKFQPERYRSEPTGPLKGYFVARNGEVVAVSGACREVFAKVLEASTSYWPKWECSRDVKARAERQAKAIARQQELEEAAMRVVAKFGIKPSDGPIRRVRKVKAAIGRF